MADPVDLTVPYGATARGFLRKNIFADQLRLLGPASRIVVDVGAHHGEELASYLAMFPAATVHAIEPTPASVEILTRTWGDDTRVRLHPYVLAENEGEARLHVYAESEWNSLAAYAPAHRPGSQGVEPTQIDVRMSTLDQLCATCGIESIDLLKLDTQGAELRVLAGASRVLRERRVRLIALELLFVPLYENQADAEAVIARLRDVGYRLYDWYNFTYDDNGQVLFGDAMFLPEHVVPENPVAMLPLPMSGDAAEAQTLRKANERLRTQVTHLEEKVERYKTKVQELRERLRRGTSPRP